jgi:hypothetical protein
LYLAELDVRLVKDYQHREFKKFSEVCRLYHCAIRVVR